MGHTVHQMFIDLTAYAFPLCRRGSRFIRGRTLSAKDRSFPLQNSIDQIFRFFDSCGHFYKQNFFPGKPLHRNILVTGHDNSCSSFNISRRQSVFHAAGSVGLNFNIYPHSSGFPLQGFCRHIGMGNTGRTGRHSSHKRFAGVCRCPGSSCCNTRCPCTCSSGTLAGSSCFFRSRCSLFRLRLFSFLFCFRFFLLYLDFLRLINDMEIFFRRLGVHQRFVELIVHQHPAQPAQYFQMNIFSSSGGRNQEKQECRFFIQAFVVHPGPHNHAGQPGSFHRFRLCMRDSNPFPDTGAAFRLPGQHSFFVQSLISQISASLHQVHQSLHCRRLVSNYSIQINALRF